MRILAYAFCFLLAIVALFAIAAVMVGAKAEKAMQNIFNKERDDQ